MIHTWRLFILGLGLLPGASCWAEGAALAKAGVGAIPACQTCHGASGEGMPQAGFPRLASLGAPYLQRQLAAFADGSRADPVMTPIANALSVADRAEVSAYYAALPAPAAAPVPATAPSVPLSTSELLGAALASRGRWSDMLPACDQCHGPGGQGVGGEFPALAGQGTTYLAKQLLAFKTGARPPGPMALMAQVSKKLSDDDVQAVARHYAALPPRPVR